MPPCPPPPTRSILKLLLSGALAGNTCALCLCGERLLQLTDTVIVRGDASQRLTLGQLVERTQLKQACNGISTKICRSCIDYIINFYNFKTRCIKSSDALQNFANTIYKETENCASDITVTKKTIALPHRGLLDYSELRNAKDTVMVTQHDCDECEKILSKPHSTASSHRCNICKLKFKNHADTLKHLKAHPKSQLTVSGIETKKHNSLYACKSCIVKNVKWTDHVEHKRVHRHERLLMNILTNGTFCACCLKDGVKLVSVERELSFECNFIGSRVSIGNMLRRIFNVDKVNRFNPMLICEECIDKTVSAYNYLQTFQQSTEIIQNCLSHLDQCIDGAVFDTPLKGYAVRVKIHFNAKAIREVKKEIDSDDDFTDVDNAPMTKEINKPMHECMRSLKGFISKKDFITHQRSHNSNDKYICRHCGKKYSSLSMLTKHASEHNKNELKKSRKHVCDHCDKGFRSKSLLKDHILKVAKIETPYQCRQCQKNFTTGLKYKNHKCFKCPECVHQPCIHEKFLSQFYKDIKLNKKDLRECVECNFEYADRITLLEHVNKVHLNHFPHLCATCGSHFPSKRMLRKHNASDHPRFTCSHCNNGFRRKETLNDHIKECITLDKPHKCDVCQAKFTLEHKAIMHQRRHFPKSFQCHICDLKWWTQEELDSHVLKHNENAGKVTLEVYPCSMCALDLSSRKERIEHETLHPVESRHICRFCTETFATRIERYEHLRNHNRVLDIKCETCGKMFDKTTISKHMKIHLKETRVKIKKETKNRKEKSFMCDACGVLKTTQQALSKHKEQHANQVKCPQCLKFVHKNLFRKHQMSHETRESDCKNAILKIYTVKGKTKKRYMRKLECEPCNYSTIFENCYEAHINKYHLKVRPYKCNVCNKAFYNKVTYHQHVKTHENLKPEQCEECGTRFGSKKALRYHMRLHSGERPYACDFCDAKFVSAGRMKAHRVRNHFKPTFPCPMCSKMYYTQRDVRKHIRETHYGEKRNRSKKEEVAVSTA